MKRIAYICSILLMVLNPIFGQSSKTKPFPGSVFRYAILADDPQGLNPVQWYVSTDPSGATKAVYGVDYTCTNLGAGATYNSTTQMVEGNGLYNVDIEWGSALTEGQVFYVFVLVTDAQTDCANTMGLPIEISAQFNALVVNVTASDNPGTVDPDDEDNDIETETCPWDPEDPIFNGVDGHNDIGYTEMVFRIERQFTVNSWQFEYRFSEQSSQSFNVEGIRFVDDEGAILSSTTDVTGSLAVPATEDYVLAYIRVTNQQGVTFNFNFDLLTGNALTKDLSNDELDSVPEDNSSSHTLKAMPIINGFTNN